MMIKNNYEQYDHDTIMNLLGRLQELQIILEKACQVLDFVRKVINSFSNDRQLPNEDHEDTNPVDTLGNEEELITETNLAAKEYESNVPNSVDKQASDEEASKKKKSRIRKHANSTDMLVNDKEKHKKKKKKGRIIREPRSC